MKRSNETSDSRPNKKRKTNTTVYDVLTLPIEIMHQIASYLDVDGSRYLLRRVCKHWLDIVNTTHFTLGLIIPSDIPDMVKYFKKYRQPIGLTFVKGYKLKWSDLKPISVLTQLTALTVKKIRTDLDPALTALVNLKSLEVHQATAKVLNKMKQLTSLKINSLDKKINLPNLVSLDFRGFLHKPGSSLAFPNLTELSVVSIGLPSGFFDQIRQVKKLTIRKNERTLMKPQEISTTFPFLESLITEVTISSDLPIETLTELRIISEVSAKMYEDLSKLTNLKALTFNDPKAQSMCLTTLTKLDDCRFLGIYPAAEPLLDQLAQGCGSTLTKLNIRITSPTDGKSLTKFTSLKSLLLEVESAQTKYDHSQIRFLTNLTKLELLSRGRAQSAQWVKTLTKLENLFLNWIYSESTIEKNLSLGSLTNLTHYAGVNVARYHDMRGLTNIQSLSLINAPGCSFNMDAHMPHLTSFSGDLNELNFDKILQITSLRSLDIDYYGDNPNTQISRLFVLSRLTRFSTISSHWSGSDLTCLTTLQELRFSTRGELDFPAYLSQKLPYLYINDHRPEIGSAFTHN